jgi:hypothetical protein
MATRVFKPALLPLILITAIGCGGKDAVSNESFFADYAQASCHRVYECCAEGDRPRSTPGPDEAGCASATKESLRMNITLALEYNEVKFDADAAVRCLAKLRTGTCPEIFDGAYGSLVACPDVFTGARQLGDVCDADFMCASGDCEGQRCVVRPCSSSHCAASDHCSAATETCVPRGVTGDACWFDDACAVGAICLQGKCTPRRQIGEACTNPGECTGTCSSNPPAQPMGACRPGRCQGV